MLVAARAPLGRLPPPDGPWPERHLAATAGVDGVPVAVLAVHAPISQRAHGVKVLALEAVRAWLAARPEPAAALLRRPQHPAPRAPRRHGDDLRP